MATKTKRSRNGDAKAKRFDVYRIVTDKVREMLKKGVAPWRKSWKMLGVGGGFPCNLRSKKDYRGVNIMILAMESMFKGYQSKYWVTFNQAKELAGYERKEITIKKGKRSWLKKIWVWPEAKGGKAADPHHGVKKGEKGTQVVFFRFRDWETEDEGGNEVTKRIPLLRYYTVFNLDQTIGLKVPKDELADAMEVVPEMEPIRAAELLLQESVAQPTVGHGGDSAYYQVRNDHVQLPEKNQFEDAEAYYSTRFHELGHSTGHESRLARDEVLTATFFGSEDYSREELVAEFTAAYLCSIAGIENSRTIENSAAYLQHWIKKLDENPKWIVSAAAAAQKATDYILGVQFDDGNENGEESNGQDS